MYYLLFIFDALRLNPMMRNRIASGFKSDSSQSPLLDKNISLMSNNGVPIPSAKGDIQNELPFLMVVAFSEIFEILQPNASIVFPSLHEEKFESTGGNFGMSTFSLHSGELSEHSMDFAEV